jgi:hypothetical protein
MEKSKQRKKSSFPVCSSLLIGCLVIVLAIHAVDLTLGFCTKTDCKENEFEMGNVQTEIRETFDPANKVKENVYIENTGNVAVYVRASVLIYWKDSTGKVIPETPVRGTDYTISNPETGWIGNGTTLSSLWYYTKPLQPSGAEAVTTSLIAACKDIGDYTDGRILVVDIVTQSIQAKPHAAAEDAWKVKVDDTTGVITYIPTN